MANSIENNDQNNVISINSYRVKKQQEKETLNMGNLIDRLLSQRGQHEALLLEALIAKATEKGMNDDDVAEMMNVTKGYFVQLKAGIRPWSRCSEEFVAGCARLLGISRLKVKYMTGKIHLSDFYDDADQTLEGFATEAMHYIIRCNTFDKKVSSRLLGLDLESKLAIIRGFERQFGRRLIPTAVEIDDI